MHQGQFQGQVFLLIPRVLVRQKLTGQQCRFYCRLASILVVV